MNKIKFSHKYNKLFTCGNGVANKVQLLQVLNIQLENLSPYFIFYDTDGKYELPKKGNYLMLIFERDNSSIFTTLRRSTPTKEKYYRSKTGKFFEVVINDSN
jgi:hypothetical protein